MDGSVRNSSRRAHPFFALFSLSFFSLIAFFSRRPVPLHHVHHPRRNLQAFPRADDDLSSSSLPPFNYTRPFAPAAAPPSLSPRPSTPSSSSFSSTSLSSTSIISSATSTTTTSTSTSSTPTPLPTLSQSHINTPTTTTVTSSTISTSASPVTTTYSSISDVTPSRTFNIGLDDSSTSTTTESSTDPPSNETSSSKATSSRQFLDNKGAVVATFLIISLLAFAFAILIIVTIMKRRKAKRDALIDSEFMPHYQEPNSPVASLSPSISSSPLDVFRSRDIVHVPIDIPPTSKPTNSHGRGIPSIHLTPPSAFPGPSRYLSPSQIPTTTNAAGQRNKSEMRVSTQSGYQRSFDSFYGAYD